ncbi:MAG: hypothetical protein DBY04_07915 [Clostridiales bacterium]|nr:MAG: hypothetical protein DBY04_07915 [Clostridiales bacterium]
MKKNTKIFALVMSIAMLFSAFSLTAFAENPINRYDYDILPGYRVNYFLRYDGNAHAITAIAGDNLAIASSMLAQTYTFCVITYTDSSFSTNSQVSDELMLGEYGTGVLSQTSVIAETGKVVDWITSDHTLIINGDVLTTFGLDMYRGEDF